MDTMDLDAAIDSSFPTPEEASAGADEPIEEATIIDAAKDKKPVVKDDDGSGEDGGEEGGEPGETEDGEPEENEKNEPEPKPKKNRAQERINQKTREIYELRRLNEELQAKIESKPPEFPEKPDPTKYTFDKNIKGDYERAVAKFNQDVGKWEASCEAIKLDHENAGTRRIQGEQQRYFSKMAADKSIYGDYNTSVKTLGNYPVTPELHQALLHDENNTDLFCFLGNPKNHAIAEDVFSLKGYVQSRKLAEISFKLQAAKTRQQAKPGNKSVPVSKPKGGRSGAGGVDFEKMSDAQYREVMGKAKAKVGRW